MSGATEPTFPATVTVSQVSAPIAVTVNEAQASNLPPGLPAYPFSTNPAQRWSLTLQNGVLTWVESPVDPALPSFALEDAAGFFAMEDGVGAILMEA
jgi:hypothetical protein